eukprot:scaffold120654_cov20-Phaeocystis_antarctica.AAC.1
MYPRACTALRPVADGPAAQPTRSPRRNRGTTQPAQRRGPTSTRIGPAAPTKAATAPPPWGPPCSASPRASSSRT